MRSFYDAVLCGLFAMLVIGPCAEAGAQAITVTPDRASAVYGLNEKIIWTVQVRDDAAAKVKEAKYDLKRSGLTEMKQGTIDLSSGKATIEGSLDQPGTLLLEVKATVGSKPGRFLGGAAIAPDQIQPTLPRPDDFDSFWAAKMKQLRDIPANPMIESAESGSAKVDYFKLKMNNINGSHVYGQLARPKDAGKHPAMLILQWAGVYGLPSSRVVERAEKGWLALNILPHDQPFDQPPEFYKKLEKTTLGNYSAIGAEDRETTYFLRMYLSCVRAADYLTSRDDWDGKTFVVMGASQGGQQTIMLAGLHSKVTAMIAMVPSSCDVGGPKAGRAIGFPNWADQAKANPKILETARYYDPVNFASLIRCPSLIAPGLVDETSPPTGVLAAFNQIKSPKRLLLMVNSNHMGDFNAQAPFYPVSEAWLNAMLKGEAVPMEESK